jgi:cytochrome c
MTLRLLMYRRISFRPCPDEFRAPAQTGEGAAPGHEQITESSVRVGTLGAVAIAGALSAMAFGAAAQEVNIAAGHAFASEACKACHVVDAQEKSPRNLAMAPGFRDIANTPGMTATALRVFMTSSHPKMPNLILGPQQTADVIAYILSLRDHP